MIITAILSVIAAYLIGSINFAVIFSSAFLKKDVRELGSGNAGTTNVMRNAGFLPGALTFICDALKGFASSYIGYLLLADSSLGSVVGAYICGAACMLGHIFPIFFQFKGGKGVATSVGIYAVCCYPAIIIGLIVFAALTLISRYVSLSSIMAATTVVILSIVFANPTASILLQVIFSVIMGAMVIIKHKENIKRLLNGTESKIGKGGKK